MFAALVNRDLADWSERLAAWVFKFDDYPSPPPSFAAFSDPPVPAFAGIKGFIGAGNGVFQMLAAQHEPGGRAGAKCRRGDGATPGSSGSKRSKQALIAVVLQQI